MLAQGFRRRNLEGLEPYVIDLTSVRDRAAPFRHRAMHRVHRRAIARSITQACDVHETEIFFALTKSPVYARSR